VHILGVGRNPMSEEEFQTLVHEALAYSKKTSISTRNSGRSFRKRLHYMAGELDDSNTYQQRASTSRRARVEGAAKSSLLSRHAAVALLTIVKHLGEADSRTKTSTGVASSSKSPSAAISNRQRH
jgi:glucose-6-phosphate 1-dehydrogenase